MAEWWSKYEGLFPGVGIFFPESNWLSLKSISGSALMTYRFHSEHPRGLIFSFHGLYSDSNDSAHICKRFHQDGFAVLAFDQDGHGRSGGTKGRVRSLKNYLQDSIKYIRKAKKRYPPVPIFIFGCSMGGAICSMLALTIPEIISGVILIAPALGIAATFEPFLQRIIRFLNICCGGLRLNGIDWNIISRNLHNIEYHKESPNFYSGRMYVETLHSFLIALEDLQKDVNNITVPLVAVQGTDDKAIDAEIVKNFIRDCKSSDKSLWLYEGMYHDVYHEPEIDEIIERMLEWINSHLTN